jgi:streptomycin 6-kinase
MPDAGHATRRAARLVAWRAGLGARAARIAAGWGLTVEGVLASGAASRLVAVRDAVGRPRVLKLAPPGQGIAAEAAALAAMQGRGAVALLRAAPEDGALLLARAVPGTMLLDLARRDDDAATRIAARLIAAMPVAPPPSALFAEVAGWGRALAAGRGRLDPALLDRTADRLAALVASAPPPLLLHGDLHHANILADGTDWVATDPKGLLGEPAAEAACLLRNPADATLLARAPRRAAIIAEEAGLDHARVLAWGSVGAVIAACWAVEDGADPAPWLAAEAALRPSSPRRSRPPPP